jgi:hypothetical protein
MITGVLAEVRTNHLQRTSPVHYRYVNPLGIIYVKRVFGNEHCQYLCKELTTHGTMVSDCGGPSSIHDIYMSSVLPY